MAGMGNDGRHRVTKMDYRFLNTLDNIGNSPEPNLTVLWTDKLPYNFRRYCMHMSHKHSSIQYEGVTTMAKDGYGEMSLHLTQKTKNNVTTSSTSVLALTFLKLFLLV